MQCTVTWPAISSQETSAVGWHAPFDFTHAHVGVAAHAAGMFVHVKELDASATPGARSTQYCDAVHVEPPHEKGPASKPESAPVSGSAASAPPHAQPNMSSVHLPFVHCHFPSQHGLP